MARKTGSTPGAWSPAEILGAGWTPSPDPCPRPRPLEAGYTVFDLARRADRFVLLCEAAVGLPLPGYSERRRLFAMIGDVSGSRPAIVAFTDAAHSAFVWSWMVDTCVGGSRQVEYRAPERIASLVRAIGRPSGRGGEGSGDLAARESVTALLCARSGNPSSGGGLPALLDDIAGLADAGRLRRAWGRLDDVAVLDPACGSGGWLLGAAEVLETVYLACLDRIRSFVDDASAARIGRRPEHLKDLRTLVGVSEDARKHPSPEEFVRRRTIQRNLFGIATSADERAATERTLVRYAGRSRDGMRILDSNVVLLRGISGSADRAAAPRSQPESTNQLGRTAIQEEWEVLSRTVSMMRKQRLEEMCAPRDLRAAAERLSLRREALLGRVEAARGAGEAPLDRAYLLDVAFLRRPGSPAFQLERGGE